MVRPISIVWFERCYLGAVAVGLLNTALNWNAAVAQTQLKMAENPQTAQFGTSFVPTMMGGFVVLGLAISALLWFFTARKASVVTKWIVTVFFGIGLIASLPKLVMGTGAGGISAVLGIVALVLNGIAVWQLFKPDARAWFGETVR